MAKSCRRNTRNRIIKKYRINSDNSQENIDKAMEHERFYWSAFEESRRVVEKFSAS
jgi:hypothetical protein